MEKMASGRRSLDSGRAEYEARLQELFEESDITDKGYLDFEELDGLCSRLQLGRLKDKVLQALKNRSIDKEKVVYSDFRHVFFALLKELEAQQSKSPRKSQSRHLDEPDKSPKATPKLVIGRKKYGRRSLPIDSDGDLKGEIGAEGSYIQFLKDLDSNDRSSPFVELEGKHVKRRRQNRVPSTSETKLQEETYEAEGQSMGSGDGASGGEVGMRQLRDVCQQLGVGSSGQLSQVEFSKVCNHIGVNTLTEAELKDLFLGIDEDKDGLISLSELISGLSASPGLPTATPKRLRSSTRSRATTPRSRSHSRTRAEERALGSRNATPSQLVSGDFHGLFSSIECSFEGVAKSEDIIDLWEELGITNGAEVLASLGFNPHGELKLQSLTAALDEELNSPTAPEPVRHVALLCYQQEVRHLKSQVDQYKDEGKKLKLDLSESNARNSLLAREVDERHAQLDKSWEMKLIDAMANIKEAYWTVDQKYQEQVKALQTELNKEREAGAAQSARLRSQLDEAQTKASQDEQKLLEKANLAQKEVARLEKELQDASSTLELLTKQNDHLKKDMQQKLHFDESSPVVDVSKRELSELKKLLELKQEESKKLKDENDELLAELEIARQKLLAQKQQVQKKGADLSSSDKSEMTQSSQSRIPVLRGSDLKMTSRASISSVDLSETEEDNTSGIASARSLQSHGPGKRQKLTGSNQSLDMDYNEAPSLSKELTQRQVEEMLERERKDLEHKYRVEVSALEDEHKAERDKIMRNFHQEKEWMLEEQKIKEETILADQQKDLQTAFAHEKQELTQKYESEKNHMQHRHKQEMEALQNRLLNAESHLSGNEKLQQLVHTLEEQLAQCQEELGDLDAQKAELESQIHHQEIMLRQQFEDERQNLAERFSREMEQMQLNHRQQMEQMISRGADGLTGKLRDDFLLLVRKHTENEVGRSQAAILNQLHRDRTGIAVAMEQEKSQMYEAVEHQKRALADKYESQISSLRHELSQLRSQLEAEKRTVTQVVQKSEEDRETSSEVMHNLKKEMEIIARRRHGRTPPVPDAVEKTKALSSPHNKEELMNELERMKELFDAEKKELETQKTLLEEELSELQGALEQERKKVTEMEALKENLKVLKSEKKEVEGMVESMKEKLFQAHQQHGAEKADWEKKVVQAKEEGLSEGLEEGIHRGREEGIHRGREEGQSHGKDEGFSQGKEAGYQEGYNAGKADGLKEGKGEVDALLGKTKSDFKAQIDALKNEKSMLENRLSVERERANKLGQQAQDRDQLKASFDLLLGEKHAMEAKHQEWYEGTLQEHQAEKDHLMEEIRRLETQRLQVQSNKNAVEAHMEAVHQEIQLAQQDLHKDEEDSSLPDMTSILALEDPTGSIQEQMTLLNCQLREAQTAQQELDHLKEEYEALLHDKADLEETIRKLRAKASEDETTKIKALKSQIKTLSDDKQKIQTLLDETSDQLMRASTSMALAQSKFVQELEVMKQKAKSGVEVESYTQLQISLVEHQRLVITLQDAIREREALVDRVISEGAEEMTRVTQLMEGKVKELQTKLDISQEQFLKQKEEYKRLKSTHNKRIILLKELYVENANLMKTFADSEDKRRHAERIARKLGHKCDKFEKIFDRLYFTLSR